MKSHAWGPHFRRGPTPLPLLLTFHCLHYVYRLKGNRCYQKTNATFWSLLHIAAAVDKIRELHGYNLKPISALHLPIGRPYPDKREIYKPWDEVHMANIVISNRSCRPSRSVFAGDRHKKIMKFVFNSHIVWDWSTTLSTRMNNMSGLLCLQLKIMPWYLSYTVTIPTPLPHNSRAHPIAQSLMYALIIRAQPWQARTPWKWV